MFFDTNVLIRARFDIAPGHEIARRLLTFDARGFQRFEGRIELVRGELPG